MTVKTPIQDFLLEHASYDPVSFHMPGHKGSALYRRMGYGKFLDNFMDCDVTEIIGADNLFQTEGIIKESMERYAELYGVKKTYLLINGTSGGILAAMMASVPKGKKIIMARNCHKSVFNGLVLADIQPVYAYPEMIDEYSISGKISPEEIDSLLSENSDAEAVILPSPNYYGICSDIETIAEKVHKHGKILIVDQAHGAHLPFFSKYGIKNMPKSAEEAGADIVICSTHKTLASLTQSAVLNLNSDRIDPYILEDKLQMIESTSPSYVLMASLDINASLLSEHGEELFHQWEKNLNIFYDRADNIKGLKYIDKIDCLDWTKINFSLGDLGLMGDETEEILLKNYNIFIELFTGDLVMCMTGIGNTGNHIKRLTDALEEIASDQRKKGASTARKKDTIKVPVNKAKLFEIPKNKMKVKLADAEGMICASSIIPYPPGIPFICPGEQLTAEAIDYVKDLRSKGEKVIGISSEGDIIVGKK